MYPADLKYSESHEWVRLEGQIAAIGITAFAQEQLGDITFVDLPKVGAAVVAGKVMGSVESVKAAADLYSPVSGTVTEVNPDLDAEPGLVNQDPYGKGWMIKVQVGELPATLLTAEKYQAAVAAGH